jgi:enamine deaminase RidA (YjgF/YER057c/UK114 family)
MDVERYSSGMTATDVDGKIVAEGDPAAQTEQILANIDAALKFFGAGLRNVVRTRIYVCNMADWEAIGRVHGKYFRETPSATSMIAVAGRIDSGMLLEIDPEAVPSV